MQCREHASGRLRVAAGDDEGAPAASLDLQRRAALEHDAESPVETEADPDPAELPQRVHLHHRDPFDRLDRDAEARDADAAGDGEATMIDAHREVQRGEHGKQQHERDDEEGEEIPIGALEVQPR